MARNVIQFQTENEASPPDPLNEASPPDPLNEDSQKFSLDTVKTQIFCLAIESLPRQTGVNILKRVNSDFHGSLNSLFEFYRSKNLVDETSSQLWNALLQNGAYNTQGTEKTRYYCPIPAIHFGFEVSCCIFTTKSG